MPCDFHLLQLGLSACHENSFSALAAEKLASGTSHWSHSRRMRLGFEQFAAFPFPRPSAVHKLPREAPLHEPQGVCLGHRPSGTKEQNTGSGWAWLASSLRATRPCVSCTRTM